MRTKNILDTQSDLGLLYRKIYYFPLLLIRIEPTTFGSNVKRHNHYTAKAVIYNVLNYENYKLLIERFKSSKL